MAARKMPTKDEIKDARAKMKQGRALVRQALTVLNKVRRRKFHRRLISKTELDFRTWKHDLGVLMPAIARTPGATTWTPEMLAKHAAEVTDRMAKEIAARKPGGDNSSHAKFRHMRKENDWWRWQETFDSLVHALAERSDLDANGVIERAAALADAMMKVITMKVVVKQRKVA